MNKKNSAVKLIFIARSIGIWREAFSKRIFIFKRKFHTRRVNLRGYIVSQVEKH